MKTMPRAAPIRRQSPSSDRAPALNDLTRSAVRGDRVLRQSTQRRDIVIPCRGMVRLDDVHGMTLRVVQGSAWITQSDSFADVSLSCGESLCVSHSGKTLIAACHDAPLTVVALESAVDGPPTLRQRLRRLLPW